MRLKTVALWAAMAAALCLGLWFIVSPSLYRQADLVHQGELMESVMAVMPVYAISNSVAETQDIEQEPTASDDAEFVTDYIDDGTDTPHEVGVPHEPDEPEMQQTEAPIYEPLNEADFPSGITPIGILTIDSIDLCLPVMEGVGEQEMRIAPGRVPQTAAVGEIGNAVIAGHRNYDYGSMFNRLGEVEIGDIIVFQVMSGEDMAFEVFEILTVTPDDQIAFIQPQNEAIITLYTCTPVRVATHRLLIRARIIEGGL